MKKKALLVGVELQNSLYSIEYTLKELEHLAKAADIMVVDKVSQKLILSILNTILVAVK